MEAARWFISGPQRQQAIKAHQQDCAAFGVVTGETPKPAVFEVDSENGEVLDLFLSLSGDWRIGPNGAMGIGKAAVKALFQLRGIRKRRWPVLLDQLQLMERAALEEISRLREQRK